MRSRIILILLISSILVPSSFSESGNDGGSEISPNEHNAYYDLTQIGAYEEYLRAQINGLEINDTYAFLAAGPVGMQIFDISDPTSPSLIVEHWRGIYDIKNMIINQSYAFVTHTNGLMIVDMSDQYNPNIIGTYSAIELDKLFLVNTTLFVTSFEDGLYIFDVSDLNNPTLQSIYTDDTSSESSPRIQDIQVVGTIGYISDGFNGLLIVDISDPTNLSLLGKYDGYNIGFAYESYVNGSILHLAFGSAGLVALDIINPNLPVYLTKWDMTTYFVNEYDGLILGADRYDTSYLHFNASQLYDLQFQLASYPFGIFDDYQIVGSLLYTHDQSTGIFVISLSDLSIFDVIGRYTKNYKMAYEMDEIQGYLAVTTLHGGIDIIDPATMTLVSNYDIFARHLHIDKAVGYNLAILDTIDGFMVLDMSDPTNIQPGGFYAYTPSPYSTTEQFHVHENILYLWDNGLKIFDISSMTPVLMGTGDIYPQAMVPKDLNYENNRLIVGTSNGVLLYDVTDPTTPVLEHEFVGYNGVGVQVHNDVAYIKTSQNLLTFDLSNAYSLSSTASGKGSRLLLNDSTLIAGDSALFSTYDLTNPLNPVLIPSDNPDANTGSLAWIGNRMYTAEQFDGIRAYSVSLVSHPHEPVTYVDLGEVQFATYYGGSNTDNVNGMAIDSLNNIVVGGYTESSDFPVLNAYDGTLGGSYDGFIGKFSSTGTLLWSTHLGDTDRINGVAIDSQDNIIVTGSTRNYDFPVINGYNSTFGGASDVFITKFSPDGTLLWSSLFGGSDYDVAYDIVLDADGNIIIAGSTDSIDLPMLNAYNTTYNNIFVAKFSPTGVPVFSSFMGGSSYDYVTAIAVDNQGGFVIGGQTSSDDFPVLNAYDDTYALNEVLCCSTDFFLSKFSATGALEFSTYFGGDYGDNHLGDITINDADQIFITGYTTSFTFPIFNGHDGAIGNREGFVSGFSSDGDLLWSTFLGGSDIDEGRGIAVDNLGRIVVSGSQWSSDFPDVNSENEHVTPSTFLAVYSELGTLLRTEFLHDGYLKAISVDNSNSIVVAGELYSAGMTPVNAYFPVYAGSTDTFLMRYGFPDVMTSSSTSAPVVVPSSSSSSSPSNPSLPSSPSTSSSATSSQTPTSSSVPESDTDTSDSPSHSDVPSSDQPQAAPIEFLPIFIGLTIIPLIYYRKNKSN